MRTLNEHNKTAQPKADTYPTLIFHRVGPTAYNNQGSDFGRGDLQV